MKHSTLGEDVGAAVVLRENSPLDEAAIRRHVASQLSDFKVPKTILFLPSLPRSTIGKVKTRHTRRTRESQTTVFPIRRQKQDYRRFSPKSWAEELRAER